MSFAVEGIVDQAVVLKLFDATSVASGTPYVCDGLGNLRQRLGGFNAGARYAPWFVLCDLDRYECAPELRSGLLGPAQAEGMELRIAVRAVEAWLLADRQSFARFLGVDARRIPRDPEHVVNPKHAVVDLARESAKRAIRAGLVPSEASGRRIGPAYTDQVIQYVRSRWSPSRARAAAPSLARAFERCEAFSRRGAWS
ncbi:MAG: hypothetical protein OXH04_13430 [Acidobacteria bacterium]|nr:hypothetical protein [Acidobacteriota bacterium]